MISLLKPKKDDKTFYRNPTAGRWQSEYTNLRGSIGCTRKFLVLKTVLTELRFF